jgi:hypothetical protein
LELELDVLDFGIIFVSGTVFFWAEEPLELELELELLETDTEVA